MTLLDRQIKAVEATLEQVIGEYWKREEHSFMVNSCFLCIEFYGKGKEKEHCIDCPLNCKRVNLHPCEEFVIEAREASLEDIAGFLQSLLISLKEMR